MNLISTSDLDVRDDASKFSNSDGSSLKVILF